VSWDPDRGLLSDQQRKAVLSIRQRILAEQDVPEAAWVDAERVSRIRSTAEGWITSTAARYLMVRL
jgi:hypothetical protein